MRSLCLSGFSIFAPFNIVLMDVMMRRTGGVIQIDTEEEKNLVLTICISLKFSIALALTTTLFVPN